MKFRDTIKSVARIPNGLNFQEAVESAAECFKTNALEFELQMVLDDPEVENPKQKSSFWILVKALKQFYATEKKLPVSGLVPDMVGETQIYLDLQKLYIKK